MPIPNYYFISRSFILSTIFGACSMSAFSQTDSIDCATYLRTPGGVSGVQIGDLDVSGNKITVEAVFNRTTAYDATYGGGDVVSKHCDPYTVNYMLRPNVVGITAGGNFYSVAAACPAELNTTYHVALVYDGSTLKFYRNNELQGVKTATGNLVNNDYLAKIGLEACTSPYATDFVGYINEVRIWNVARTAQQLLQYYRTQLPNPTTQTGLLAYYTFNSLQNKQGNTTWNATLLGTAVLNQTNTHCPVNGKYCVYNPLSLTTPDPRPEQQNPLYGTIVLYPNPVRESVTLEYTASSKRVVDIKVVNVAGQTSLYRRETMRTGKNTIGLNVHALSSGMYFVQVINEGNVQTEKLVVVR